MKIEEIELQMINRDKLATNASLLGGLGLALIGTTCALPILLVTLGMGAMAQYGYLDPIGGNRLSITSLKPLAG